MRLKLDENLPESLLVVLTALGHDVESVRQEGLVGRSDSEVWQEAQTSRRLLLTQGLDFSDIRKFTPSTHNGLLLLRLHLAGRLALARRLLEVFQTEDVENWRGCFVLVTDRKIRLRRPGK